MIENKPVIFDEKLSFRQLNSVEAKASYLANAAKANFLALDEKFIVQKHTLDSDGLEFKGVNEGQRPFLTALRDFIIADVVGLEKSVFDKMEFKAVVEHRVQNQSRITQRRQYWISVAEKLLTAKPVVDYNTVDTIVSSINYARICGKETLSITGYSAESNPGEFYTNFSARKEKNFIPEFSLLMSWWKRADKLIATEDVESIRKKQEEIRKHLLAMRAKLSAQEISFPHQTKTENFQSSSNRQPLIKSSKASTYISAGLTSAAISVGFTKISITVLVVYVTALAAISATGVGVIIASAAVVGFLVGLLVYHLLNKKQSQKNTAGIVRSPSTLFARSRGSSNSEELSLDLLSVDHEHYGSTTNNRRS